MFSVSMLNTKFSPGKSPGKIMISVPYSEYFFWKIILPSENIYTGLGISVVLFYYLFFLFC